MKELKDPKLVKEIASATIFNVKKDCLELSLCAVGNQYFRYYDVRQNK